MKSPSRRLALGTLTAMASFGLASAAGAAGDTTVQFAMTAGSLSVALDTGQDGTVDLGSSAFSLSGNAYEGNLDVVKVTDETNLLGVWCVDIALSDADTDGSEGFESGANEVDGSYAEVWVPGAVTTTLSMTGVAQSAVEGGGLTLDQTRDLIGGATALGGGTVTFTPYIKVEPPSGTASGTYTGTITYTADSAACGT